MSSAPDSLYMGIDLGTSSVKTVVVDHWGKTVAAATRSYRLDVSAEGKAEQDPEEWWRAVLETMREAAQAAGAQKIRSVGVTGQWSGTVAVDQNLEALHPAIIWLDTRGQQAVRRLTAGFPSLSGYRIDKLATWIRLTGGAPTHSGKDSLAHILYIKTAMPELYAQTRWFLEPKDYIVARLTGRVAASWDNVALLWATDNRDPNNIRYSQKLLEMNGLDRQKLPELVSPLSVVGTLRADVAGYTGLQENTKVISGCGDMQASLIGVGAVEDFEAHLYLGTSSWLTAHVPFKKTDIFHSIASLPAAVPGKYFVAAEQENAGSCLEHLAAILGLSGPEKYDEINRLCALSAPGSNGLIFLPWLFGERAPVEDPFVRGGFFNLGLTATRGDFVRAVMEGVAMNTRWLFGAFEGFLRRRVDKILMAGGGALSPLWPQIFADVLNRRVVVAPDPKHSTARGVAMLSAVGAGFKRLEDLRSLGEGGATYQPVAEHTRIYDQLFRHFLAYYRNNAAAMRAINSGREPFAQQASLLPRSP